MKTFGKMMVVCTLSFIFLGGCHNIQSQNVYDIIGKPTKYDSKIMNTYGAYCHNHITINNTPAMVLVVDLFARGMYQFRWNLTNSSGFAKIQLDEKSRSQFTCFKKSLEVRKFNQFRKDKIYALWNNPYGTCEDARIVELQPFQVDQGVRKQLRGKLIFNLIGEEAPRYIKIGHMWKIREFYVRIDLLSLRCK